ncbi:ABC transporter permease, partial [Jeotgalibaca porci]
MTDLSISNLSLAMTGFLIVIALIIDYKEKLELGKDILIAAVRAVIQLFIIGYVLGYIFELDNIIITSTMVLFIITNAAYHASLRANKIKHAFKISLAAIGVGTLVSLLVLLLSGALKWTPS